MEFIGIPVWLENVILTVLLCIVGCGLWKMVELAIWFFSHLSINWN